MPLPSIESLRRELREKFPQAHAFRAEIADEIPTADWFSCNTFPAGSVSEVISDGSVSGLGLWISGLLGNPHETSLHPELVLLDGTDSFDPASFTGTACSRLLWVRCRAMGEMLKAADLLARDGNVPFLLLDAMGMERKDLQACPASAWWRLKRIVEGNGARLVVMASFSIVPCAARRWSMSADFSLDDFDRSGEELRQRLRVVTERLQRVN